MRLTSVNLNRRGAETRRKRIRRFAIGAQLDSSASLRLGGKLVLNVKMKAAIDRRAVLFEQILRQFLFVNKSCTQFFEKICFDRRSRSGGAKDDTRSGLGPVCDR